MSRDLLLGDGKQVTTEGLSVALGESLLKHFLEKLSDSFAFLSVTIL